MKHTQIFSRSDMPLHGLPPGRGLVQFGGNPHAVICSQGIVRSPSEAMFLLFYSQFSPCRAGIWRSLESSRAVFEYAIVKIETFQVDRLAMRPFIETPRSMYLPTRALAPVQNTLGGRVSGVRQFGSDVGQVGNLPVKMAGSKPALPKG